MKSRERVQLALDHKEPDRVPIDLGATIVSSITRRAYVDLKQYSGMPLEEIKMLDHVQQLPYVDEVLLERFGVDFRLVQLPSATAPDLEVFEEGDYYAFIDRWGSKLHMPKGGGFYFDWVDFPIKEATMEALDQYRWPRPDPQAYNLELGKLARQLYEETDYALVGSAVIGGGIFEQPARMMGMANFLMALVSEPGFADRLMEQITDIYIESCNNYLDEVGKYIQVFTYCDDVNPQDGWMIRPDLFRKMIKPKERRLVEAIKKKTDAKIFFHGCGATFDLIPDLIDLGFDILNPVQVSARGMDTKRLKEEFGKDIVFWGGGVDTQHVLPFGTPEEVARYTRGEIEALGAYRGGYIGCGELEADVPLANAEAMYAAFAAYRY